MPFLSKKPSKALEAEGAPKEKIEDEEDMHGLDSPTKKRKAVKSDDEKPKKVAKKGKAKAKKEESEEEELSPLEEESEEEKLAPSPRRTGRKGAKVEPKEEED